MSKKALCVGINDYPYAGSDLNGCVNDAQAWAELLTDHYGFPSSDVTLLLDSQATKANVMAVQSQSGVGCFGPSSSALSAVPDTRAQPGKYHPKKLNAMKKSANPRHRRLNPPYALSPVQTAHRPISKLTHS